MDSFDRFFNHVIAPAHVPYIYGRMLILALFYQLTLRHYNRRISCATILRMSEFLPRYIYS